MSTSDYQPTVNLGKSDNHELVLTLALDGDAQSCMEHLGMSQTRVVQRALHLARDPEVALAHPMLVQRIHERLEHRRQQRSVRGR